MHTLHIPVCMHCRGAHTVSTETRPDSRGRPRAHWTCPTTGRGGSTPLRTTTTQEPDMARSPVSVPVSVPATQTPDLSDVHLFVILDSLMAALAAGTPGESEVLRARGDMLAEQVAGRIPAQDPYAGVRAIGAQLADVLPAYCAHALVTPQVWSALYPQAAAAAAAAPLSPMVPYRITPTGTQATAPARPSMGPIDDATAALVEMGVPRPLLEAGGALAGGAAGMYLGGPTGAAMGASLGGALMAGDSSDPKAQSETLANYLPFADYMQRPALSRAPL